MKKLAFYLFIVIFILTIIANLVITNKTDGKTFSQIDKIDKNKVGLVLGTPKYTKSGKLNPYFKYRIRATAKLYKAGKIDTILISGDKRKNEPSDFLEALQKYGIPESKIIIDSNAVHTINSVFGAREIYRIKKLTFISQKFHNQRAIFLAQHYNIKAIGFNAKDPKRKLPITLNDIREYFAKTKAFYQVLFHINPKIQEKIPK